MKVLRITSDAFETIYQDKPVYDIKEAELTAVTCNIKGFLSRYNIQFDHLR